MITYGIDPVTLLSMVTILAVALSVVSGFRYRNLARTMESCSLMIAASNCKPETAKVTAVRNEFMHKSVEIKYGDTTMKSHQKWFFTDKSIPKVGDTVKIVIIAGRAYVM